MMSIEGVLGESTEFQINMLRCDAGLLLFHALQPWYRIVLVSNEPDPLKLTHWIRAQSIVGHAEFLTGADAQRNHRSVQLRALRSARTDVGLVVDADPTTVALAAEQGIPGLLFVPGRVGTARTDLKRSRRDWGAIEAEIDSQRALRPVQTAETP